MTAPREGWAKAFKRAFEEGPDALLIPDFFEEETDILIDKEGNSGADGSFELY